MEKKYLSKDKLVGKQVIDSNAIIVGNVKDMMFDIEAKEICITIASKTGGEVTVSGSELVNVGDVVLLNKKIDLPIPAATPVTPVPAAPTYSPPPVKEAVTQPSVTPGLCKVCGYQNEASSKFCIKCGSKL